MNKIILAVLLSAIAFAAYPDRTLQFDIRPTNGSDTNGGAFSNGASGTDYSQNNNKNASGCSNCGSSTVNLSTTDAVSNGTTTITSATANFSSAIVGNLIYLSGGTAPITAAWYYVTTFTNSTTIVVDRTVATGTGATMNIGGALKTMAQANTIMSGTSAQAFVKAESTITTAATINLNMNSTGSAAFIGYTSTHGDNGYVTIQATGASFYIITMANNNSQMTFKNFILDCNGQSACGGITAVHAAETIENVKVLNPTGTTAFNCGNIRCTIRYGYVTGANTSSAQFVLGNFDSTACYFCVAVSGVQTAFSMGTMCYGCIAANNTGASTDGFSSAASLPAMCINCIAYNNGRDGFRLANTVLGYGVEFVNSVFYGNGGKNIDFPALTNPLPTVGTNNFGWNYNAYTSGSVTGILPGPNDITLTGDPFVNGASNNFALNNTAGAGAALRQTGFPGVLNIGGTGYQYVGALVPQASTSATIGTPIGQ